LPSESEVQERAKAKMWIHPGSVKEMLGFQSSVAAVQRIDQLCIQMSLCLLDLIQMGGFCSTFPS